MYFPNRLELSFFRVLALPKACGKAEILFMKTLVSNLLLIFIQRWRYPSDLEDGVGHEHFVADGVEQSRARAADGVILQNLLGGLSLPCAALTGDEDEMVVELCQHGLVGVVCQGVTAGAVPFHG